MDTLPAFGSTDLLAHIIGDTAKAVSERPGQSQKQELARAQAAAGAIIGFRPADAVEAMFAGHCVMFHELIVDSVHTTLHTEEHPARRATRSAIVAMDKAFGANLTRLEEYRTRQKEASAAEIEAETRAETEIADRVQRHQTDTPQPRTTAAYGRPAETAPAQPVRHADRTHPAAIARFAGNRQARRHPNP